MIANSLRSFGILFLSITSTAFAVDPALQMGIYQEPSAIGLAQSFSPDSLRVVQWNLHRFEEIHRAGWSCEQNFSEFCETIRTANILLLQESGAPIGYRSEVDRLFRNHFSHYVFAPYGGLSQPSGNSAAWYTWSAETKLEAGIIQRSRGGEGMTTLTQAFPLTRRVSYSDTPDNFYNQFMPLLATEHAIENSEHTLLIVHFHNKALVGSHSQEQLLARAETIIANHEGPVLFAGDFNTWSTEKSAALQATVARLGMREIAFSSPFRGNGAQLDHAFVRGLAVRAGSVQVYPFTTGLSDHMAISYELVVE